VNFSLCARLAYLCSNYHKGGRFSSGFGCIGIGGGAGHGEVNGAAGLVQLLPGLQHEALLDGVLLHVVEDEVHARPVPVVGHGVLGLVVELHNGARRELDLGDSHRMQWRNREEWRGEKGGVE
jgi:hypothetical protein